jgi:hypothetical protein
MHELCSNNAAFSIENANVRCSILLSLHFDCSPQLKHQLHELQLRLERQAAQVVSRFIQVLTISMLHNRSVCGRHNSPKTIEPASTGSPRTAGEDSGAGS